MFKSKLSQVAQLFSIHAMDEMERTQEQGGEQRLTVSSHIQSNWEVHKLDFLHILLVEFEDLFVEPTSLPT